MVLNDKQKRAFKAACIAEIKAAADRCSKVSDEQTLFAYCQHIQSYAIKIFESSKGSINDEYYFALFPSNTQADDSASV